jgi:hypothetical protein
MGKRRGAILAGIAFVLTAIFYGRAVRFDLQCDDLLVIRHWSRAELAAVWHGTWEPHHVFATFYRPLATWFYAGTFELFGYNATAHMLLSLAMLAAVAWLLALFVARESESGVTGMFAVMMYLSHPNVPWSTGTWVTNDFHKLTAISALCGLLLWQRLRQREPRLWLRLLPFVAISFLVKEDGLMLLPALLSIQWARAKLVGDVKAPGVLAVVAAGAFGAALLLWRYLALHELGGFGIPPVTDMFQNLARGPLYAFTFHGALSVLTLGEKFTAVLVALVVAGGITIMPREKRFLPVAGLLLMFWYDLPLALISNVMRYYMLTIASVMVLAPVFFAWLTAPTYRWAGAVPLGMMVFVSIAGRHQDAELDRFAPCGWAEKRCAPWVIEEVPGLPAEVRAYVADTENACAINPNARPRIGDLVGESKK